MPIKVANNATSILTGALTTGSLSLSVTGGEGAKFPTLAAGETFQVTLTKLVVGVPVYEIVQVTARATDTMTIVRAQEGTAATTFSAGDRIELRFTEAAYNSKANLDGAAFTKQVTTPYVDSLAVNTLDFRAGAHQRWAPATGAQTLTITNWPPAGQHGDILIEGVNLGAATITSAAAITWIKPDGTFTVSTNFTANHGAALQAAGIDFVLLWTRDGGATVYGKVVR